MNEQPLPPEPEAVPEFKDRRAALKVFGVLELLCGALAALMIPFMLLGQYMAARFNPEAMPLRQMVQGAVFYAVVAVAFVWVGIGSLQARRWGRALSLILSWSWLLVGVVSLAFMIWLLPGVLNASQAQGGPMPDEVRLVVMVVALGVVGFFFIAVPAVFVGFYQSRHVKATCEAFDPEPRWTEACPLPVLALSLWLGLGALTLLLMPVSANGTLPVFGRLISGPAGWLGCVVLAGVLGWSAWALYRLQQAGWWVALVLGCLGAVSNFLTFSRVDLFTMYRTMGYPERQIEMMRQSGFMQGSWMICLSVGSAVCMLAYLLFIGRYLRARPEGRKAEGSPVAALRREP